MRISDWSSDVCSSDLPLAEITAHDRLYGGFERAYAAQRTTAQQIATDQSGDQRQRQGPQQALAQDHVDLVDNAGRTRQHQQLSVVETQRQRARALPRPPVDAAHATRKQAHATGAADSGPQSRKIDRNSAASGK